MPSQTLKQYIQRTSDEELKNIDNMISAEMGRRSLKIQADLLGFDFDKISYFMNWSLFSEKQLSTILHNVVEELNKQKAKRQNVDVGFWDSDGNYKEDIQEINETDEWINNEGRGMTDAEVILLISEIGRLRRFVKTLKQVNNRLIYNLKNERENNKILRKQLEEKQWTNSNTKSKKSKN